MSCWSPDDAIAMERRHVFEGEERIARQLELVSKLVGKGPDHLAHTADELLVLLRECLELSRMRLRQLECRYGNPDQLRQPCRVSNFRD